MNLLDKLKALIGEVEGHDPAVFADDSESPVSFVAAPSGDRVRWTGTLFRAGDYGRKGKYTAEHLRGLATRFPAEGVKVKDTHIGETVPLVFHELLKASGTRVARVWTTDDGERLDGEFDAPKWLHDAFKEANLTKKVSIGLTGDRQAIEEVSLVLNPHIEDAAVFERDMAQAFSASPEFEAFAAAHPDDARLVTEAAKAHVPPPAMLTQEQKIEEAKKAYAALPQFMRDEATEADFVAKFTAKQTDKSATTQEDPEVRKQLAEMEARFSTIEGAMAGQSDQTDALLFYKAQFAAGKATPNDEKAIVDDFLFRRSYDRLKAQSEKAQFSAKAENSKEAELHDIWEKKSVVFNWTSQLSSQSPAFVPANANSLGIFSDDDFKKAPEAK